LVFAYIITDNIDCGILHLEADQNVSIKVVERPWESIVLSISVI